MGKKPEIQDAGGRLITHGKSGQAGEGIDLSTDDVVLLTGAYCPKGCPLVHEETPTFDGFHGIVLDARNEQVSGTLVLSPFQGDSRKRGPGFEEGDILTLACPICHADLDVVGPCGCDTGGQYVAFYTVRVPDPDYMVAVCRRWGCFSSYVKDAGKIVSEYRTGKDGPA